MRKGFTAFDLTFVVLIVAIVAAVTIPRLIKTNPESERYVLLAELVNGKYEEPVVYDTFHNQGWRMELSLNGCVAVRTEKNRADLLDEPIGVPHFFLRETPVVTGGFVFERYALKWNAKGHVLQCEERLSPDPNAGAFRRTFYLLRPFGKGGISATPITGE